MLDKIEEQTYTTALAMLLAVVGICFVALRGFHVFGEILLHEHEKKMKDKLASDKGADEVSLQFYYKQLEPTIKKAAMRQVYRKLRSRNREDALGIKEPCTKKFAKPLFYRYAIEHILHAQDGINIISLSLLEADRTE